MACHHLHILQLAIEVMQLANAEMNVVHIKYLRRSNEAVQRRSAGRPVATNFYSNSSSITVTQATQTSWWLYLLERKRVVESPMTNTWPRSAALRACAAASRLDELGQNSTCQILTCMLQIALLRHV